MAKFANVVLKVDTSHVRRSIRGSFIELGIPLHRADRPQDSCSLVVNQPWRSDKVPCRDCEDNPYVGRHAAARVAEDERRAL